MGVKKTKESIKQRFYWDGMNKEIAEYVKSCRLCQLNKPSGQGSNSPSQGCVLILVDLPKPNPTLGSSAVVLSLNTFSNHRILYETETCLVAIQHFFRFSWLHCK